MSPAQEVSTSEVPLKPLEPSPSQVRLSLKTVVIMSGILLLLATVGVAGRWFFARQSIPSASPVSQKQTLPQPSVTLLTWDDPAGFTFQYPQELIIDKHDEDQENYAQVELTHPEHPGGVIVWAKDLPLTKKRVAITDASEWVMSDAVLSDGSVVDSTLGGEVAKKVFLSAPDRLFTGTVYDDVLWYIEGKLTDKVFWSEVHKTISSSFTFKPLVSGESGEPADIEVAVDEEEVVE